MKITRMTKGEWGHVRAFLDIEVVEGITVKGFKLVVKDDRLRLVTASVKKKDDSGYDQIVNLDKMQYITLNNLANDYYKNGGDSREDDPIPF